MTQNIDTTVTLSADDATATALVDTIKATTNGEAKYDAYVASHDVDADNLKSHAEALVALAYPTLPTVQKKDGVRTKYGHALNTTKVGLKRAIDRAADESDPEPKAVTLRAVLSGEGGGSTTIEPGTDLYAALVALITNK